MKAAVPVAATVFVLASTAAFADEATCDRIREANIHTSRTGTTMKFTGYDFAKDTPKLYGFGEHACDYVRDEAVDGIPAAVYREEYKGDSGRTTATIWIAKSSGHLLREEQDGDITGKGKGHISYRWPSKP